MSGAARSSAEKGHNQRAEPEQVQHESNRVTVLPSIAQRCQSDEIVSGAAGKAASICRFTGSTRMSL